MVQTEGQTHSCKTVQVQQQKQRQLHLSVQALTAESMRSLHVTCCAPSDTSILVLSTGDTNCRQTYKVATPPQPASSPVLPSFHLSSQISPNLLTRRAVKEDHGGNLVPCKGVVHEAHIATLDRVQEGTLLVNEPIKTGAAWATIQP